MCLTLKDATPGKPVIIESCRDGDNKQVGTSVQWQGVFLVPSSSRGFKAKAGHVLG